MKKYFYLIIALGLLSFNWPKKNKEIQGVYVYRQYYGDGCQRSIIRIDSLFIERSGNFRIMHFEPFNNTVSVNRFQPTFISKGKWKMNGATLTFVFDINKSIRKLEYIKEMEGSNSSARLVLQSGEEIFEYVKVD